MTEAIRSIKSAAPLRAGFGQRAVAIGVDLLLVNLVIAVIGLAVMGLVGEKVRVASTVLNVFNCARSVPASSDLKLPDSFKAANQRLCTRSVFGIEHDWTLVVSEAVKAGEDANDAWLITMPADRTGRPVQVFYLDDLILVVLGIYLLVFEWRLGASLGKLVVGIRVQSQSGAPLTVFQASRRILPKLILLLVVFGATGSDLRRSLTANHWINLALVTSYSTADFGQMPEAVKFVAFLCVIGLVVAGARRKQPLHDQWAATEVVCCQRRNQKLDIT